MKCTYARFRPGGRPSPNVSIGARSVGHHTVKPLWKDNVFQTGHVIFFWGIKGTGIVTIDDEPCNLPPEHIGLLMPGTTQNIYALDEVWEYCWWTMDGPFAESVTKGFGFNEGIYEAGPAPLEMIAELDSIIQHPGRSNEIAAASIAFNMLSLAAKYSVPPNSDQYDEGLVEKAKEEILSSWHDSEFSVDTLSDRLEVHRSTLCRRFHRVTGTTVIGYITGVRMQNAMSMLRQSTFSVAEISRQCGYRDPNYFSRLLKSRMGATPSEFRKIS